MTRAFACAIAVLASGCIKPAVTCRSGDRACEEVRDLMERARGNLGGWCGTNRASLPGMLAKIRSPALAHYLEDPDPYVARAAAATIRNLGGDALIAELCASGYVILNRQICR